MGNKCILLSRVSTNQQTLEQQTNELISFANNRGYSKDNQIIIEDKESAIKLDEEQRHGLIKMKQLINEDKSINCVICYEVSRLSRRQKVLFSLRDYFIENKIQLVILKPFMELLDKDGNLTPTANIVFSLFSTISENEMTLKKERMERGRKQKKSEGKIGSGRPVFGYTTDEYGNIIVDKEKSIFVIQIFNMYINGKSGGSIAKEMLERGVLPCKNIESALTLTGRILRNKRYIGVNDGFDTIYPAIISEETFNKARDIAKNLTKGGYTNVSCVYYAHNIIRCKDNNRLLTPSKGTCSYSMYSANNKSYLTMNINIVDSIVWHVVKQYKKEHLDFDIRKMKYEIAASLIKYNKKIEKNKEEISRLSTQIERVERRIIEGKMDEIRGDKMIIEFGEEIQKYKVDSNKWQYEIDQLTEELSNISTTNKRDYDKIQDDDEIYDIIHKTLKMIWISRGANHGEYIMEFEFKTGLIETYRALNNGRTRKLWDSDNNEVSFEYIERIKRKSYKKK